VDGGHTASVVMGVEFCGVGPGVAIDPGVGKSGVVWELVLSEMLAQAVIIGSIVVGGSG